MPMYSQKRFICLLLTLAAAAMYSCQSGDDEPDPALTDTATDSDTSSESVSETTAYQESEPKDYGGLDFVIWYNGDTWEPNQDVAAEELNGETMNDAIFNRNTAIEDKYNVRLDASYHQDLPGDVRRSVNAADDSVDLILDLPRNSFTLGLEGVVMDINELPGLCLDGPWWDSTIYSDTTVNGVNFFSLCSMNIHAWGATPVVVFSKKLADDYNLGDLYELMEDGDWTIDYIMETSKNILRDLDGNGEYTLDDQYGFIANNFSVDCLFGGSGYKFIEKDDDGWLTSNLISEELYDIYDKIRRLTLLENGAYLTDRYLGAHFDAEIEVAFENNQALFWVTNLKGVQRRRTMPGDFGVLPMPKIDESQTKYYAHLQLGVGDSVSVPATCSDTDMVGRILEDFAYYSYKEVIPAFYEITVKGKSMRDEGSAKTLDILLSNYYYDIGGLHGIVSSFRDPVTKNNENIVSWLESQTSAFEAKIDKYNEYFFGEE